MKKLLKFIILFFCLWVGTKSILEFREPDETLTSAIIDLFLFIIFIGSPAASFWGYQIDQAFGSEEEEKKEE